MRTRLPDGRSRAAILNPLLPARAVPLGSTAVKLPLTQPSLVAAVAGVGLPARRTVDRAEAATAVVASSRRNIRSPKVSVHRDRSRWLLTTVGDEASGSPLDFGPTTSG